MLIFAGCQSVSNQKIKVGNLDPTKNIEISSPDPEGLRHFMDGQMLMNQGNYPMAIIKFQEALEVDPKAGSINTSIAECYWSLGKLNLSEKHLKIAINKDPLDQRALKLLADQYVIQKKYTAAELPYETLSALNPSDLQYILARAELKKIKKDFSEAIRLYLKGYELEPDRLELLENAGRLAVQSGNKQKALSIFKDLSVKDLSNERYLAIYTELSIDLKKINDAINFIESILYQKSENLVAKSQLALLYSKSGENKKAEILLKSIIEVMPGNSNYYYSLFDIYMDQNKYIEAEKISIKMISIFPDDWRAYYSQSLIYLTQDNYKKIIPLLEPVSTEFKNVFAIQYIVGLAYSKLSLNDDALLYYGKALLLQPNSVSLLHSLAVLYDEISDWNKSDKIYDQLIALDSSDAQAYNNYAYSLVERNQDLNKALKLATKAILLEPKNPSYLDTIGWVYFKLNKFKKAKKYIEAAIEIDEDSAVILEHLGDIYIKLNKFKNANKLYKKALLLDKSNARLIGKVSSE